MSSSGGSTRRPRRGGRGGGNKPSKKAQQSAGGQSGDGGGESTDVLKQLQIAQAELEQKRRELEEEKERRNYFQLERNKINSFWEIEKRRVEELEAELRNKDREMEELEERSQVELKVYKQKVRHLLYEQKIAIDRLKIESENALKMQADEFRQKVQQLKADKRALKQSIKSAQLAHEETVKALKLQQDRNVTKQYEEFERQLKEIQFKYEERMKRQREDLETRAEKQVSDIEERKNTHIRELMQRHQQAFDDMKNYYNRITTNNLVLIKSLRDEVASMKKNEANNEKLIFEIAQENKRLADPLMVALAEVNQLRTELANYQKDKLSLRNAKGRIAALEERAKTLSWEKEVIEQSHRALQKERDELYRKFEKTIHDVQQKTMFKNQLLETKVQALSEAVEHKDAQLRHVLQSVNLPEEVLQDMARDTEDVVEQQRQTIRDLQFECDKSRRAYHELVDYVQGKLQQYGISAEEFELPSLQQQGHSGMLVS